MPIQTNPHGLFSIFSVKETNHVKQVQPTIVPEPILTPIIPPLQPRTIPTKFVTVMPIEKKEEKQEGFKEFKYFKYVEGPTICTSINVKAFAHLLREGLTTGMSNRVYLQRGYHKFWIPITFLTPPKTTPKLEITFMYTNSILKSWEFQVISTEGGYGSQIDLDLLTDKFFLQKRLYRFEFMCEDFKVITPEFSIVNLQQFTKTKKRKFSITKWTFAGVNPPNGSTKGGEFIGLYFNEPFNPQDKIYFDGIEVKCLFSGFNGSSMYLNAKYMVIVESPKHDAGDIFISVGGNSSTIPFTFV